MRMSDQEKKVLEFQQKYGSPTPRMIDAEASLNDSQNSVELGAISLRLKTMEEQLASLIHFRKDDTRLLRAKLMISELSEVIEALAIRDEVELADGLADLMYVTIGTAVTYSIPIGEVFNEVHRSNMTKSTVQEAVANHTGDKGKGPGFEKPAIHFVIAEARSVK